MYKKKFYKSWWALLLLVALFSALISNTVLWGKCFSLLFPGQTSLIYPRGTLWDLVTEHLILVIFSSLLALLVAIPFGIFVTRPTGKDFLPLANELSSLSQTFPPVAVIALAVPTLGFGFKPTIIALLLYGILPILRNTIVGIQEVPQDVLEAALGMGMTPWQTLTKVELPLSWKIIMAGIRTSVVINIGTATIGATIGAGGLGAPIVAGLINDNPAFILEGAIPVALLAILADLILTNIEKTV